MPSNIPLIVFPVKDIAEAKSFYSTYLGTEPYADSPYYVGYKVGELEVGLDPSAKAIVSYIAVNDIEASIKTLKEVGAELTMEVKDVGGGRLVAQVEFQGNTMGLRQDPQ
jgi:predicted enzyme related to lactoylglutathione lyase